MARPAKRFSSREFNQGTGAAKRAACEGPVYITHRGRPSHVLLSYDHYCNLISDKPSIVDILGRTPGVGDVELDISRSDDPPRPFSFD